LFFDVGNSPANVGKLRAGKALVPRELCFKFVDAVVFLFGFGLELIDALGE
jgi:hypothetical protein